jgi:mRNA-degrading endonuclease RelE of RelBE toxin-antitoxin system
MERTDRYEVEILPRAEKDLKALKQHRVQAVREILKLEVNPRLGHALTCSLRGTRSLEFNLKGGGAYRAVYTVLEDERVCVVFLVKSHEHVYLQGSREALGSGQEEPRITRAGASRPE